MGHVGSYFSHESPASAAWSLSHWTTREIPSFSILKIILLCFLNTNGIYVYCRNIRFHNLAFKQKSKVI